MKKEKILIVGAGEGGTALLKMFKGSRRAEVVAVVDKDPEARGIKLAKKMGIKTTGDYKKLLKQKKVDQIINVTGLKKVQRELGEVKPASPELINGKTAKFIWGLVKEHQNTEKRLQKNQYSLKEKNKELEYFFNFNKLVGESPHSLEKIMQGAVNLIPPAYQYPDITCAKIKLGGREFKSAGCRRWAKKWRQKVDIANKEKIGSIEVCYAKKKPTANEGPFLKEERKLLDAIAERLARIVERLESERRVKKSEKYFHNIINTIDDPVFVKDKNHRWILLNDAYCDFMGYPRKKLLGKSDYNFFPKKEANVFWEKDEETFKKGRTENEEKFTDRAGKTHIIVTKKRVYGKKRGEKFLVGVIRDITKLKKIQTNLELFKKILETSTDAIGIADFDGRHYYQNEAFTKLFGKIGKDPVASTYVSPKTGKEVFAAIMAGGRWRGKVQMRAADKKIHNILLRAYAIKNDKGGVTALAGVYTDITDRKEAEKKLQGAQQRLNLILANATDGIWTIDLEGNFTFVSPSFERLLGYKPEEILKKRIGQLLTQKSADKADRILKEALKQKKPAPVTLELEHITKKGVSVPHEAKVGPIYDHAKRVVGFVGVTRDITERMQAEEAMRLAQLGKLVGSMAHEVNNPLMVISGRAQLIKMEAVKSRVINEGTDIIMEQCQRAKAIIEMLLKFSRPPAKKIRPADINYSLGKIINLIKHQFFLENIKIVKKYTPSLPKVNVDQGQLQEVVLNLMNNAKEAMVDKKRGRITVKTYQRGGKVAIDVIDNGEGIDKKNIKKIVNPFFSTKEMGTGLGLSVCYSIVNAHGGKLEYQSRKGEGTTMTILLPIKKRGGR